MPGQPAPLLPEATLARRGALPRKPEAVALRGALVRLAPLDLERDTPALFARTNGQPSTLGDRAIGAYDADALIWRYLFAGPFATAGDLAAWLRSQVEAADGRCFAAFDLASGEPVGVINLMNNSPEHLKIEVGGIWYSPLVQGAGVNMEAVYLLLRHVFALGYRRAEWKCDALNRRSRHAAERLGFRFEGVQEAHFIIKGRNRDTAWFRLLDHEWPEAQRRLEQIMTAERGRSRSE